MTGIWNRRLKGWLWIHVDTFSKVIKIHAGKNYKFKMNIITLAPTFLVLLMLGGDNGHLNIDNLIQEKCNKEHSFVTSIVETVASKAVDAEAHLACTGSLIKFGWVITTSACFYKFLRKHGALRSYPNIKVRAAFDSEQGTFEERELSRYIPYDKKAGMRSDTDDILLIELKEPFKPSSKLSLIKPATKSQVENCKEAETVSPIPVHEQGGSRGLMNKLVVDKVCRGITLVQNGVCSRVWSWLKSTAPSLCGETKESKSWWNVFKREAHSNVSTCEGAEGSPLVCGNVLIAIETRCKRSSARSNTAQTSFVRLDKYLDFIAETVGDDSLKGEPDKKVGKDKNDSLVEKLVDKTKKKVKQAIEDKIGKFLASTSGAEHLDGAFWKMTAGVSLVLFIYL